MKKLLSLILLLSSTLAFGDTEQARSYQYFVAVNFGPDWVGHIKSPTFNQDTDYEMAYRNKSNSAILDAELVVGFQSSLTPFILSQLGLAIGKTRDIPISGHILEFSNPAFNNFKYNYEVNHTDLSIKGKWIVNTDLFVHPYVSASMGLNFNQTTEFNIHPLTDQETYDPPISHHRTNTFMYTVGTGLQFMINANWQLGMGYQFENLGKTRVSVDGNQLNNNHLYAQLLQFNVTYLF